MLQIIFDGAGLKTHLSLIYECFKLHANRCTSFIEGFIRKNAWEQHITETRRSFRNWSQFTNVILKNYTYCKLEDTFLTASEVYTSTHPVS